MLTETLLKSPPLWLVDVLMCLSLIGYSEKCAKIYLSAFSRFFDSSQFTVDVLYTHFHAQKRQKKSIRLSSWDGILERQFSQDSGHKLESSLTRVFVWFSALVCLSYKILFMDRFEFFLFRGFFCMEFLIQSGVWFSLTSAVEETLNSMEQKYRVFCQVQCPQIPS